MSASLVGSEMCIRDRKLVGMARDAEGTSNYHLNGFLKLTAPVQTYLCAAAVGSFPVESFVAEVLEDDRLLRRKRELEQTV
eukprot:12651890-Alexandrium_andersonii.AAC.1